jgi:hypothetical protein
MNKKFSWRAFISFGLTWAMLIVFLSGIMLYVAPPGRYAHWVNWTIWGYSKGEWQAIHTLFSLAFVILSVLHLIWINWKSFVSYLKSKKQKGFIKTREFSFSLILVLVVFLGTVFSIPPFKNVVDLGEGLTNSWEKTEERAPVPHAEILTLAELTEQLHFESVDQLTRKLDNNKIGYKDVHTQTLQEIADANDNTPMGIYEIISKTAANRGQGMGVGRKTIEDFSNELDKSTDEIIRILKENNIAAKAGQTLRTIGENNNLPPRDVYKLISQ